MPNRLAGQTSPYLRQHADNPVDWFPWGEEALERARREDKPILLSIGYSACHWCHVMAHESFEDAGVAEVMNRLFISVKVDREERPDLDQIYQLAHQMLAQRAGGWPLTVFMTPAQVPFYTGTYFPKEARYGLPGFAGVCERVADAWRTQRADIERQNGVLMQAFSRQVAVAPAPAGPAGLTAAPIDAALEGLKSSFDARNGGFGGAPKFPHPAEIELCLRRFAAGGDGEARHAALFTLERMALGGIYDQLGGGFARYSVDAEWAIPHFEKMLYDNGPLLRLYADAWCISGNPLFARVAEQTAGWIMREMQSPGAGEGGYYSSLDADSEHEEGRFYVWDREQVRRLLSAAEYEVAAAHYGLEGPANFEGRHWHLRVVQLLTELAGRTGRAPQECERLLESARLKLLSEREGRVRPGRDDKILAGWNALAIRGMARAGSAFGRDDWVASARRAFDFLRRSMWKDGMLLATCKDGRAHLNAYLDDYAYLLLASIELLQAGFDAGTLEFARELGDALIERFEDKAAGAFFFTGHDHESLIARLKPFSDGATPSGNGVAALALHRLSFLTGEARYSQAAGGAVAAAQGSIEDMPAAHASLLMALEEQLQPTRTVIVRGPQQAAGEWRARLARMYLPHTLTLAIPEGIRPLPEPLEKPVAASVNAWVCEGVVCLAPIASFDDLAERVSKPGQSS
jgi:uncharacterized protein YyaL (SSP411 family)